MLKLAAIAFRGTNYLQLQYSYKSSTIDAAMRDTFCPVITFSGGVTKFVLHAIFYKKYISPKKMNSVQVLFMSALYVSALFSKYKSKNINSFFIQRSVMRSLLYKLLFCKIYPLRDDKLNF